jgi:hypothetical protein
MMAPTDRQLDKEIGMFVKVIYPDGQDVMHQCNRRRIRRLRGDEHLFILLDGHIEIEVKDGTEAFVMNDKGHTLEAHRTKLAATTTGTG